MLKKWTYKFFLVVSILLSVMVFVDAQTDSVATVIYDTTTITDTSILEVDSLQVQADSLAKDSTISKWDFKTLGGNDSTYYSFYGHLLNYKDTIKTGFWHYNLNTHDLDISHYDSTLEDFHIYNPAFRNSINNSYLGHLGLAVKSNIFAQPNPEYGFILLNSFTPYMFLSDDVMYYNVKKPFTVFQAHMAPKDELDIEVLHTQNINRYLNAFVRFKNFTGDGFYLNQKTRDNAVTLGFSYTKGRYATHFNSSFNRIDAEENGGIVDSYFITDSSLITTGVPVKLSGAKTFAKDKQMFFDQKIGFLKTNVPDTAQIGNYWFSFQYTFRNQKTRKVYVDETDEYFNPISHDTLHLYNNTYNGGATFDSTSYHYRNNNFRINLEENQFSYPFVGAFFGYGNERNVYYYDNKVDSITDYSQKNTLKSSYFEGGLYRLKGEKFKFTAQYKLFISGYRQTDFTLDGFISQKFGSEDKEFELKGYGGLYVKTPDFLLTRYYSNHYRWENNLNQEKRTSFNFKFSYPHYFFETGTRFNILTDYVYFDTLGMPAQYDNTFSVFDIYANKIFHFGNFGLNTRLNYQKTSNNTVLPLPEFSGYAAFYWGPDVHFASTGGNLRFHIGIDAYYWTSYYGQAYSPSLGLFYNQSKQQVGNYPFVGMFFNFELKRFRFYLRYEHANYDLTKPANYFWTPDYPTDKNVVRYGITWTFYD